MEHISADVVIVGSGVSGALFAHQISQHGLKVLILEAGTHVDRNQAFGKYLNAPEKTLDSPYEEWKLGSDNSFIQDGLDQFKSSYLRKVGGTTWHWLGICPRLLPEDFKMKSLYDLGVDWPIDYETLEPWYDKAEKELGVAGKNDQDLGSPRQQNYPLPEIPYTRTDKFVIKNLKNSKYENLINHTPQARNSVAYDNRPQCCGAASCIPICPIQAKYDATVHVEKAQHCGASLITDAVVFRVVSESSGKITEVHYKKSNKQVYIVRAKIFVLAANAIETAKLLLISKSEFFQNGIANQSDQVGRNLMDHPASLSYAIAPEKIFPYQAPLQTAGIDFFRKGAFRKEYAAYRIQIQNSGWEFPKISEGGGIQSVVEKLIEQGFTGKALKHELENLVSKQICFASMLEQLPDINNRVQVAYNNLDSFGIPKPKITYQLDMYTKKALIESKKQMVEILKILKCTEIQSSNDYFGAGHIMGTYRMGLNSKSSVVNSNLQCHGHFNLFLLGAGVMPTAGTANPTLTIAALALRCADFVIKNFRGLHAET